MTQSMAHGTRRILLCGGGTAGPVTPLLAVVENLRVSARNKAESLDVLWLGTVSGPERELVEKAGIKFVAIPGGKLRRYFSLQNFTDLFRVFAGFIQAFKIIGDFRPHVILSAGGFVSVPTIVAGFVKGVPSLIHQQDYLVSLTTRMSAPFCKVITTSFASVANHLGGKAVWTGQPVRTFLLNASKQESIVKLGLNKDLPVILITGGGTGALSLNQAVAEILPRILPIAQVVHLTGRGKTVEVNLSAELASRYRQYEFLSDEMAQAYGAADIVVSRSGASASFELAVLGKPVILIPLPDSPQVLNAREFGRNNAALVIDQSQAQDKLLDTIKNLLQDTELRQKLSTNISKMNPPDALDKLTNQVLKIISGRVG